MFRTMVSCLGGVSDTATPALADSPSQRMVRSMWRTAGSLPFCTAIMETTLRFA